MRLKVLWALGFMVLGAAVVTLLDSRIGGESLLATESSKVIRFNTDTGEGILVGTATGQIRGVTINNFKFSEASSGLPNITFDNRIGITDLDGDQIVFHSVGTGKFVVPPLIDE